MSLHLNISLYPSSAMGNKDPVTNFYRIACRMLPTANERTAIPTIIEPIIAHINGVQTTCFANNQVLINHAAFSTSLIADYFIKSTDEQIFIIFGIVFHSFNKTICLMY